jgi:hypothetical protein
MSLGWLNELLRESLLIWVASPLSFIALAVLFAGLGYLISRTIHIGAIRGHLATTEALKAHLAFKEDAIKSAAASLATATQPAAPATSPTPNSLSSPGESKQDYRFASHNEKFTAQLEATIRAALLNTSYKFVYNPSTGAHKTLTFLSNGEVNEGRNGNEYRWRISGGRLEFTNDRAEIYSRFFFIPEQNSFHHTNDDLGGLKGQFMVPIR